MLKNPHCKIKRMAKQKDNKNTILVIDDDPGLLRLVEIALDAHGFEVQTATSGQAGIELVQAHSPDIIILDVMMPEMDGLEVCRKVREQSPVPIIFLSARGHVQARIEGLLSGADDYMLKPFNVQELIVRIETLFWRMRHPVDNAHMRRFSNGLLVINPQTHQVFIKGEAIHVSEKEYNLLDYLTEMPGRILSVDRIYDRVWAYNSDANPRTVRWYIWRLRQKIEPDPANPQFIITESGLGYRFSRR